MSVNMNTALNAYNNMANINTDNADSSATSSTGGSDFAKAIDSSLNTLSSSLNNAENTVIKSLVKQADITDVVTAITNAEVTLRTVIQIRDKLVSAHQEILRMPI